MTRDDMEPVSNTSRLPRGTNAIGCYNATEERPRVCISIADAKTLGNPERMDTDIHIDSSSTCQDDDTLVEQRQQYFNKGIFAFSIAEGSMSFSVDLNGQQQFVSLDRFLELNTDPNSRGHALNLADCQSHYLLNNGIIFDNINTLLGERQCTIQWKGCLFPLSRVEEFQGDRRKVIFVLKCVIDEFEVTVIWNSADKKWIGEPTKGGFEILTKLDHHHKV